MMTMTDKLIHLANIYCASVQRSRSRVSTMIFGDGTRLDGIAGGKDLNTRSYEKAIFWFSDNWPPKTEWPADIERPKLGAVS